jgi:bifunctional DNA primase/polymerase-like protein
VEQDDTAAAAPGGKIIDTTTSENRQPPPDMRLAAKAYRDRGWSPIPLKRNSKAPIARNWTRLVVGDKTEWPGNIGVRLGEPSSGLVDLDLDCDEARLLAPAVLPPTGAVFGRPGAPQSHWLYDCGESAPTSASTGARFAPGFGEAKDKPLLEVRSTGGLRSDDVPALSAPDGGTTSLGKVSRTYPH